MLLFHMVVILSSPAQNTFYGGEGASFSISQLEGRQKEKNELITAGLSNFDSEVDICSSEEMGKIISDIVAGPSDSRGDRPSCSPTLRFVSMSNQINIEQVFHLIMLHCR